MHDSDYDRLMRTLKGEESRALVQQSVVLRERAADAVAVSRRLRRDAAVLGESVAHFLRLVKR